MITTNLEKKQNENDKHYQLLLDNPEEKKKYDIIRKLSPKSIVSENIKNVETARGIAIQKEKFGKFYGDMVTEDEIIKEAMKFNLAFCSASYYEGNYSPKLIEGINEYISTRQEGEEGTKRIESTDIVHSMYVLTPMDNSTYGRKTKKTSKDPLVLLKMSEDREYYAIVGGSKNYINLLNSWKGFRYKNKKTYMISNLIFAFFASLLLLSSLALLTPAPSAIILGAFIFSLLGFIKQPKTKDYYNDEKYNQYDY